MSGLSNCNHGWGEYKGELGECPFCISFKERNKNVIQEVQPNMRTTVGIMVAHPKKGTKNDANYMEKPPLDLLTLEFQTQTAQALGFGAGKYGRHNFKEGIDHSRLIAACLRHINQYNAGQDTDSESGLSHLAHAAASLNMLMWMVANRPELDDRYKK